MLIEQLLVMTIPKCVLRKKHTWIRLQSVIQIPNTDQRSLSTEISWKNSSNLKDCCQNLTGSPRLAFFWKKFPTIKKKDDCFQSCIISNQGDAGEESSVEEGDNEPIIEADFPHDIIVDSDNDSAQYDDDASVTHEGLIELLETVLSFHAYYKRGHPFEWLTTSLSESQYACRQLRLKVRMLIRMIVKRVPRNTGNGWKLQKLHDLLHIPDNILYFGSPQNFDAGPGESFLKPFAKDHSFVSRKAGSQMFIRSIGAQIWISVLFSKLFRDLSPVEMAPIQKKTL